MKQDRILEVADKIEGLSPLQLFMNRWFTCPPHMPMADEPFCAACVAGWTAWWAGKVDGEYLDSPENTHRDAALHLGLTTPQSTALFLPEMQAGVNTDYRGIPYTPRRAAAVLRWLAKTGTVRWDLFNEDGENRHAVREEG